MANVGAKTQGGEASWRANQAIKFQEDDPGAYLNAFEQPSEEAS